MQSRKNRIVAARMPRAAAIVVLSTGALFGGALQIARGQTPEDVPSQRAQATAARNPAVTRAHWSGHETIDQRITSLHAQLKITPDEETQWSNVAQTMRDNESAMEKLATEAKAESPETETAPDDLKSYQKFAQNHADGLTKLIASFDTLYTAMPDTQKKIADQVFNKFGRPPTRHHA
jgi:hypothetical protein